MPELARPRGQHKVFLGMAVGVGKTFRMLQEAQFVSAEGRDVAIGLLETHGRPETAAVATGLELIPRRLVPVDGAVIEEMDLSAILRRAPQVCLIDELAHTNAPGLEHDQRYQDVEDVLTAGINVFSTVNVQHLQSVSERIAEKTVIVIRETIPDRVIDEADEVVVVDLTPEALQARIIDGKVFPAGSVPVALERFFTKDNLDVLREMALLQVVEEVEAHRLTAEILNEQDRLITNLPAERAHRFLGLIKPDRSANRIIRRAWTIAERLGGELDLLWVASPDHAADAGTNRRIAELRRLAAVFGAHMIVETDRSIAQAVSVAPCCGSPSSRNWRPASRPSTSAASSRNVANKFLLDGFFSVERTWRNICAVRNVSDFKTVTSYRLIGKDQYEQVAPGGELKHGTLGNETYTNKADTYGLMLSIDRRDIINDDLGAITTVPRKLGRGSGLKINDVFWATFLNNSAFFTAGNKNYLTGADTVAGDRRADRRPRWPSWTRCDSDGKPIGIMPAILLVPTALSAMGTQLFKSLEIRDTTASTKYPIANPHQGKFRVGGQPLPGQQPLHGQLQQGLVSAGRSERPAGDRGGVPQRPGVAHDRDGRGRLHGPGHPDARLPRFRRRPARYPRRREEQGRGVMKAFGAEWAVCLSIPLEHKRNIFHGNCNLRDGRRYRRLYPDRRRGRGRCRGARRSGGRGPHADRRQRARLAGGRRRVRFPQGHRGRLGHRRRHEGLLGCDQQAGDGHGQHEQVSRQDDQGRGRW